LAQTAAAARAHQAIARRTKALLFFAFAFDNRVLRSWHYWAANTGVAH
jgi:hypothetical protein